MATLAHSPAEELWKYRASLSSVTKDEFFEIVEKALKDPTSEKPLDRSISHNPEHYKEDFIVGLTAALEAWQHPYSSETAEKMAEEFYESQWDYLPRLAEEFSPEVFGYFMLFAIEAGTSLQNYSEVTTRGEFLERFGLTIEDLKWPKAVLHPIYEDFGIDDITAYEILQKHVAQWKVSQL